MSSGSGSSRKSPNIEIFEIRVTSQNVLKSIKVSMGSFNQESPCLPNVKTHKFKLSAHWHLSPLDPLCLTVRYRDFKLLTFKCEVVIRHNEVLNDAGHQKLEEWSQSYDKFSVVLGLTVSPNVENASTGAGFSTDPELPPTTDAIFKLVDRFRVLVIGNSGVGKSSLINECFGVTEAAVSHGKPGKSNINTPIIARENGRFVLHDSQGFEAGEGNNFQTVIKFLKAGKEMPNVRDQIHAVWLCFEVPLDGSQRLEAGVEEFFRMKASGEFGPVPVITIFTKYDLLVDEVEYGGDLNICNRKKDLSPEAYNALLVKETRAKFQEFCVLPFEETIGSDIPHIAVSTHKKYGGTRKSLNELTQLTAQRVKECLAVDVAEEVAVLSAVAQRVNPAVKIDAVIAVGKKHYWKGLASSVNFPGKTIEACLHVLHVDIVRVWNIQDGCGYLESKELRGLMIALVGDQYDELSDPNTTIVRALPLFSGLAALIGCLSAPAAPIVLPIVATVILAKWVYDVYQQSALVLQRLMAYIVDFSITMQVIFSLVVNARLRLSRRLIKLAFATYSKAEERRKVHKEIKDHVKRAGRADRDATLAKIIQLIKEYQMKSEGMDQLELTMKGFQNDEDEDWDVGKKA